MERVETLLKKLQEQFANKAPAAHLLLTVQMLQAELQLLSQGPVEQDNNISITLSQNTFVNPAEEQGVKEAINIPEEKIFEILQVDEAEIEAELEEIKRNAEVMKKISVQNKPAIQFEPDEQMEEDIPTLAQQMRGIPGQIKKEINETAASGSTSLNEKLKQAKIDLGDTFTEVPIRDLRKAIGVNDRFLFISKLFRGDEVSYERSIKTINSFSILPEAEYWIQRELKLKNGWEVNNEVVKQFDQLVKRRFS
jgi:hypothetical protein